MPDRGKLYCFTSEDVTVIRPWPDPRAWIRRAGEPWRPTMPLIHLEGPNGRAQQSAWRAIPDWAQGAVLRAHCAGFQWSSLNLLARCPGALDLVDSVPVLAAMMAIGNRFRPRPVAKPWRSARALLRTPDGWHRWRRICAALGQPKTRSFVRMLRKVDFQPPGMNWTRGDLQYLTGLWSVPTARKLLQHAPVVSLRLVHVIREFAGLVGIEAAVRALHPTIAVELADRSRFGAVHLAHEITAYWPLLQPHRPLPRFVSIEAMETVRADLRIEWVQRTQDRAPDEQDFPPPPFEGTAAIVPLTNREALAREGRSMRHCIGLSHWAAMACVRVGYGYHVEHNGEQATVWLMRKQHDPGTFVIDQIQGPGNTQPTRGLRRMVAAWLEHRMAWATHRTHGGPEPSSPEPAPVPREWQTNPAPVARMLLGHHALIGFDDEVPF